jgi:hypothetical protein
MVWWTLAAARDARGVEQRGTVTGAAVLTRMPPIWSTEWFRDSTLVRRHAAKVCQYVLGESLGGRYPDPGTRCVEFHGASYSLQPEEYWLFQCSRPGEGFEHQAHYYLLADSAKPTVEWIRWEVTAPSGSPRDAWPALARTLVDSLSVLAPKDVAQVGAMVDSCVRWKDSRVVVKLWDWSGHPLRVTIDRYSESLLRNLQSPPWLAYEDDWRPFEGAPSRRVEIARRLRKAAPRGARLAEATAAESVRASDLPAVIGAIREGRDRRPATSSQSDLMLYRAHDWLRRYMELMGHDTTAVGILRDSLQAVGMGLVQTHEGDWCYDGSIAESLATHPGASWMTEEAFLERMEQGWEDLCGLCGWSKDFGPNQWKAVLARGEAFLRANPKSRIAPRVTLLLAQAHETAWSLSKATTDESEEYISVNYYRLEAPTHRREAIGLYERYLRLNPKDPGAFAIRTRLARMQLDVDTNYHRFWCVWD